MARLTSITERCSGCDVIVQTFPEPAVPVVGFVSIRRNITLTFCVPCSADEQQVERTFAIWALRLMR